MYNMDDKDRSAQRAQGDAVNHGGFQPPFDPTLHTPASQAEEANIHSPLPQNNAPISSFQPAQVPPFQSTQAPYGRQVPPVQAAPPPKRGSRFNLLLPLVMLLIFGTGLFAGWEFANRNISSSGSPASFITTSTGSVPETDREAVVARVRPAVVQINVSTQEGAGLGSGVIIDRRGYIVTNNHVVTGGQNIQVVLFNGTTLPATLVGAAPDDDLAVIKVDPAKIDLATATIGDSSKLRVGQEVLAIGNPLGITQTVTGGIISALGRNVATGPNMAILPSTVQTDAAINPGNSGGALVDMQGNLIGIPTLTAIDPEFKTPANGVGFAIPANRVKFIVPQLIDSGKVTKTGRAALGVQIADVDPATAAQSRLPVDYGALLVKITLNGAADKAGLKPNDLIVQVDNKQVIGALSLSDVLITKNPGDTVPIQFYRGNKQLSVDATLGELPAH